MDASIKGENIKTFVRLLQCASKFGDDLHIHASPKAWELSVTNSSKSAFCLFKLDKSFFCRWEPKQRKGVKCRLLVKSVLSVLGKTSQITTVNRVDLRIIDPSDDLRPTKRRKGASTSVTNPDDTRAERGSTQRRIGDEDDYESDDDARVGIEAKLIMRLVCKHGVTKKHSLHLGSSDFLRADVDPDTTPSGFTIASRTLRDWLDHFSIAISSTSGYPSNSNSAGGLNQLGWMFTKNEVRVKSWEGGASGLSTEIKVDVGEFEDYEIVEKRIDLTLPMKEFKATLVLAEQLSITLNVSFSSATQPLTLTSLMEELEEFSIFCAIATTSCEAFTDVRQSSVDIKRSRSTDTPLRGGDGPQPPGSGAGRSRRGSEVPSQRRSRSSLSFSTGEQEGGAMATVHISGGSLAAMASSSAPVRALPSNSGQPRQISAMVDQTGNEDEARGASPGRDTSPVKEGLFFPTSQPNHSQGSPPPELPANTQTIRMTQEEVLAAAGLGDIDLDEELENAEEEDEREMEEEFRMSQAQTRQPDIAAEGTRSREQEMLATGAGEGAGEAGPSTTGRPTWVADDSNLVWALPGEDDHLDNAKGKSVSPTKRGGGESRDDSRSPTKKRGSVSSAQGRSVSPQKRGGSVLRESVSPEKRSGSKSPVKTTSRSPEKEVRKAPERVEEEDELDDSDEENFAQTQMTRKGNFEPLFDD
ncbi:hypothetical protein CI109_104557 [Kwoniella shandongensis]|uniref:Uncharacterized protein n=1 Tax=Kwoniella shandongensis TaxID=1734106 RepID=A0A5M6BYS9_9TREE|nr:uncharacterized protein CI109_005553 [Kwoniella shandongensis]KAA5526119.1 hypothetical protein CI109_005553 [Kwoniella shandongensis]